MAETKTCDLAVGILVNGEQYFAGEAKGVELKLVKDNAKGKPVVPVGEVSICVSVDGEEHFLNGRVGLPTSIFFNSSCPYPPPICPPGFSQSQYKSDLGTESEYYIEKQS